MSRAILTLSRSWYSLRCWAISPFRFLSSVSRWPIVSCFIGNTKRRGITKSGNNIHLLRMYCIQTVLNPLWYRLLPSGHFLLEGNNLWDWAIASLRPSCIRISRSEVNLIDTQGQFAKNYCSQSHRLSESDATATKRSSECRPWTWIRRSCHKRILFLFPLKGSQHGAAWAAGEHRILLTARATAWRADRAKRGLPDFIFSSLHTAHKVLSK